MSDDPRSARSPFEELGDTILELAERVTRDRGFVVPGSFAHPNSVPVPLGWPPIGRLSIDVPQLHAALRRRRTKGRRQAADSVEREAEALITAVRTAAASFGSIQEGPRRPDQTRRQLKAFTAALEKLLTKAWNLDAPGPPLKLDPSEAQAEYPGALRDARILVGFDDTCDAAPTFEGFCAAHPDVARSLGTHARMIFERRSAHRMTEPKLAAEILAAYFGVEVKTIKPLLPTRKTSKRK